MTIRWGYLCSVCGRDCSGANHRFCAWVTVNALTVRRWQYALETGRLNDEDTLHLCGQQCLHRLIDRFAEQKASQPVSESAGQQEEELPSEPAGEPTRKARG
jgi:hypothetical protein